MRDFEDDIREICSPVICHIHMIEAVFDSLAYKDPMWEHTTREYAERNVVLPLKALRKYLTEDPK